MKSTIENPARCSSAGQPSLQQVGAPARRLAAAFRAAGLLACCVATHTTAQDLPLEEVRVTASLREMPLEELPASATVLPTRVLQQAGIQHFEDVVGLVPNLNYSAGSSRPRYFQIRGIGELEQYEGAPNPSVGFLIDDIDFSGLGMPATLFDVGQIEVLRGPQGTRYGANALAGLISVSGRDPAESFGVATEVTAGEYATRSAGLVVTGPVEALRSAYRVSVQQSASDGFQRNAHLGRDDTNDREELSARVKWRWSPGESAQVDVALLHFDLDNGYDAFAIDNSRTTLSDDPGQDSQRATGGSVRWRQQLGAERSFTLIAGGVDSDSVHAYDGDWGNANAWAPYTYDFVYRAERERRTGSLEVRLEGQGALEWLVGAYTLDLDERIDEVSAGRYVDPLFDFALDVDDRGVSEYDARTYAVFGQLDGAIDSHWNWSLGLRGESRDADFRAHDPRTIEPAATLSTSDEMVGGQFTLSRALGSDARVYASVSRGYKAGGFNLSTQLPDALRRFDPEYLMNFEVGGRGTFYAGVLDFDLSLFYARRDDVQIRTGEQLVAGDPNSFVFFTGNAAKGTNYGLESSLSWRVRVGLDLFGTLGWLDATFEDYAVPDGPTSDREQPHAPGYTFSLGGAYRHASGFIVRVDVTGKDAFYFDAPPIDARSDPYVLTNLRVGYERERWQLYAWVRNVFDEEYATRGFFFGNEPPDFSNELYVQLGEPQQLGVTLRVTF